MKKLIIKNSYGEKLAGILHESKSENIVLVCPGRVCTKEEYFYPELCESLASNGFNSFRFDFSGNGESGGKFEECTISKDILDIKSVVDYFKSKGYEIFCLIGHSLGAVEVLLYQSKYNSARRVVDIAAYADQRDATIKKFSEKQIEELNEKGFIKANSWGKKFNVYKKYFYDRANYWDIRKQVKKIKTPILVVHGTEDKDVPLENSEKIAFALNKKSKFVPIIGAEHFYANPKHRQRLFKEINSWLKLQ